MSSRYKDLGKASQAVSMAYTNALRQGELVCWRARNPKRLRKRVRGEWWESGLRARSTGWI